MHFKRNLRGAKLIIFACIGLVFAVPAILKAQTTFEKRYDAGGNEKVYSGIKSDGNGYLLIGYANANKSGDRDLYMLKINSSGDSVWTKKFSSIGEDEGHSIIKAKDGGYIIAGYKDGMGKFQLNSRAYIIKTDSTGSIKWEREFGIEQLGWKRESNIPSYYIINDKVSEKAQASIAISTKSGNYIIAGNMHQGYSDDYRYRYFECIFVIMINDHGDVVWKKSYLEEENQSSNVFDLIESYDNAYIVAANKYLLKIDSLGEKIWAVKNNDNGVCYFYSIIPANDNGYIVSGAFMGEDESGYDRNYILVANIDNQGVINWSKLFGGKKYNPAYLSRNNDIYEKIAYDKAVSIKSLKNGYVVGCTKDRSYNLIRLSNHGDSCWAKTFNLFCEQKKVGGGISKIIDISNNSYFIVGNIETGEVGGTDIYIIKSDSCGFVKGRQELETLAKNKEERPIKQYYNELRYYKNSNMGYEGSLYLTDEHGRPYADIHVRLFAKNRKITYILLKLHNMGSREYLNFIAFAPMIEFRVDPANPILVAFCFPYELKTKKLLDITYVKPGEQAEYLFHFEDPYCQPYSCDNYSTVYSISEILKGEARMVIQVAGVLFPIDNFRKYGK